MVMTRAMKMVADRMMKSMPSKAMNKNDAARVEAAIRKNPKLYRGLSPHEVLDMLPPKGMTGKVIGMPIKGKTTKKSFGGILKKGSEIGKDILGKFTTSGKGVKNKKGQTKTITRRDSIQNKKTGQIKTNQGKGKKVGITQAQDKKTGKLKTIKKSKQNAIDKNVRNTKALAGAKNIGKTMVLAGGIGVSSKIKNPSIANLPKTKTTTTKTKKTTTKPTAMPKPRPKKKMYMKEGSGLPYADKKPRKDSNVEFVVGKAKKKLFGGGKVGGMKVGPATHNRLY
tara:strand:- start:2443 stop:3288 length:846 start_codon:yes stop_codon:yes gene_type:complete